MTLDGRAQAPGAHSALSVQQHCAAGKRFTVRDGFHLKTHNAEAHALLDAQLGGTSREDSPELAESGDLVTVTAGPTNDELPPAASSPRRLTKTAANSNNNNLDDRRHNEREDGGTEAPAVGETQTSTPAAAALGQLLLQSEDGKKRSGRTRTRERVSGRVRAALQAPSKWLIYRPRPSETLQRKQQTVDNLLHEMLQEPHLPTPVDIKQDEVRAPSRPRCQSTLGSTYSQRVAAARPARRPPHELKQHYQRTHLQPLTETERGLLRSREDNNKAVDKLLVSLFHPPSTPSTPSGVVMPIAPIVNPTTPSARFSTRRSVIRHETAVALRSRNLVSRMNELRSLPQLLEQMEALQLWKKQQHIVEHGVDLVARNRANPNLLVLQKPSHTPLLPSATDHKIHQASKRKQELDAAQEKRVHRIVVRWQTRREERAEEVRRIHVRSQWLLLVTLAESSKKWLTKFHEFRLKRSVLMRISMAKRLQRYWRQRTLVKRNLLQLVRFAPSTPLSSTFFRMPVVIQAVSTLQQKTRKCLVWKHERERSEAVALIITAWFEFQDVKFRRIILRFRKRVRDFQIMWRAWRAITAARIKLLLLVWAKLERKIRRRHGVAATHPSVSFSVADAHHLKAGDAASPGNLTTGNGLTLHNMLQRSAADRPLNQQHKQLEDIHRHFLNGGAVHMPISAVSPSALSSEASPSISFQPSPPPSDKSRIQRPTENAHVRQDLKLKQNMGEEFQLVMYDVYTTRQNLSKSSSLSWPNHRAAPRPEPKRSPGKSRQSPRSCSHQQQSPPLQLPPPSSVPVPPPTKKVPQQLKVALLRNILSEKRKLYSDTRDRGRETWAAARKQMRSEAFRYDVLDEMEAFQQLQAKYATFLLLHSVSETEMVRLILYAQEQASKEPNGTAASGADAHAHRKSFHNG